MNRRTPFSPVRLLTTALLATLVQVSIWPDATAIPATGATYAEPRFYIEAVEVRGVRHVSSAVVASESLVEGGQVYTESDLRDALRRIRRLPFVLEADFALAKGRERGSYVLLVDVIETKRFFYHLGLEQSLFEEGVALEREGRLGDNLAGGVVVGARLFVGRYGMLFAAAGDEGGQLGFTRYNLFGKNAVLSLGLETASCCATEPAPLALDPVFASWIDDGDARGATLTLGVPVGARASVHGSVAFHESDRGFRRPVLPSPDSPARADYENRREEEMRLAWSYDTNDDPVFPFQGTSVVVAVDYRSLEADLTSLGDVAMSSELVRISVLGRRHWPFARRHAFAAGFSVAAGRSDVDNVPIRAGRLVSDSLDTWEASATLRHSMRLRAVTRGGGYSRLYWQNELEYFWNATSPELALAFDSLEVAAFSSAIVYRSAWGLVRIGLRLIDVGDVL